MEVALAVWPALTRGHLPVPAAWRDLSQGVHPMVTRVPAPAGAAIIFTEALQHVTLPWTVPNTRTTLFYKYTPQGEAYSGQASFFCPSTPRHTHIPTTMAFSCACQLVDFLHGQGHHRP